MKTKVRKKLELGARKNLGVRQRAAENRAREGPDVDRCAEEIRLRVLQHGEVTRTVDQTCENSHLLEKPSPESFPCVMNISLLVFPA